MRKYVDDLITAIPIDQLQHIIDTFNSYDIHIQFTYELEVENRLPFLDMLLCRHDNQKITTRWYQKPIASGRFLNFRSFHPMSQKLNTAKNFIKRVDQLSTDLDEQDKNNIIDEQLKINNYPKSLRRRLANRMNERNELHTADEPDLEYTYHSIAYMPHLSECIDKELKRNYKNIRLATYNWKTVGDLFSKVKDPISAENQTDVVYSIPCNNCSACYIGMTTNRLRTRISGHKTHYNTLERLLQNQIQTTDPEIASLKEKTALLDHSITKNHRFNLEKTKILDKTNKTHTLPFLEMCHITNNSNSINRRTDTENLNSIYAGILHLLNNIQNRNNTHDTTLNTDNTTTQTIAPLSQTHM